MSTTPGPSDEECPACHGSGRTTVEPLGPLSSLCRTCGGLGTRAAALALQLAGYTSKPCPRCLGGGQFRSGPRQWAEFCTLCEGTGMAKDQP